MKMRRFALVLGIWLALSVSSPANAQEAFNYAPITDPILGATFSVNFAALTANPTVGGIQVNSVQLWNVQNMTSLDLTTEMFGNAAYPAPPLINQDPLETGFVSAAINPSFYGALQSGEVGLTALFTDTDDGWFAIDTIELSITTEAGTSTYWYGSSPNGFGIGIPVGGDLPGPVNEALPYTGTGFDEAISSKNIDVVTPELVPEPGTMALFVLGALAAAAATRRWRKSVACLLLFCLAIGTQAQTSNNIPAVPHGGAAALDNMDEMGREYVPGEVLIVFKHREAEREKERKASMDKARVRLKQEMKLAGVHHAVVHSGQTVHGAVKALRADPAVESASPNYIYNLKDNAYLPTPNDTSYQRQWHLNNNGRTAQRTPGLMHVDNAPANSMYDSGEAIYTDADASGTVTAGDYRELPAAGSPLPVGVVKATDADAVAALPLIPFNPNEGYTVAAGSFSDSLALKNVFIARFTLTGGPPAPPPLDMDGIYRDVDNTGTVTANDIRLKSTLGYAAAAGAVAAGAPDLGLKLQRFPNAIIDADIDAPQGWRFSTDGSATVVAVIDSGIDVAHPDIVNNLWTGLGGIHGQSFCATEKHDTNQAPAHPAGQPNDTSYFSGEGVYLDVDNSGTVTVGDVRILPPIAPAGLAVATAVVAGDGDIGVNLFTFDQNLPTTLETHTGVNMAVGQYVYNDRALLIRPAGAPTVVTAGDIRLTAVGPLAAGTTVNAGDADVTPIALVAFPANMKYVDLNANGVYDSGEPIYTDAAGNGMVTVPPDVLLSGPAQANGAALVAFNPIVVHDTTAGGGPAYKVGDGIYTDGDGSFTVTAGDSRITPSTVYPLAAGGVAADDADVIPRLLHRFPATFRHSDPGGNRSFVANDFIYNHTANVAGLPGEGVTPGDTRITQTFAGLLAGSVVAAGAPGNADVGLPLTRFFYFSAGSERHTENVSANGRYDANFPPPAGPLAYEFIYADSDNSFTVSPGDTRLTAVTVGATVYAAGSTVMPGDADAPAPTPLEGFADNEMHTENIAVNGLYDDGEYIYRINSGNYVTVDVGDERLTATAGGAAGTIVAAGDADFGLQLVTFTEAHDTTAGAGPAFVPGDGIYRDNDTNGVVSPGDTRITPPASIPALAAGTVAAGNADARQFLVDFASDLQGNVIQDVSSSGHGTAVAGVIGAQGNNNRGVTGVCWTARIMGLKYGSSDSSIINCINWIMGQKASGVPVKIVNMSLGSASLSPALSTAMNNAMNTGMLFTVAAGNEANDNNPQGESQECIYRAAMNDGTLTAGDTRITGYGRPGLGLGAGTAVGAGDEDFIAFTARNTFNAAVARPRPPYLHSFLPIEKYFDANANGQYDAGEIAYRDMDGSGMVSINDVRLATTVINNQIYTVGRVVMNDPDIGRRLTPFGDHELYHDISQNIGDATHLLNYYDGTLTEFPASYNLPREITVAATDNADNLASFSSWGTQNVHLAAPGKSIYTLKPGNAYQWIDGTSFAAPLVAGILDHMWSLPANQSDSPDLIKQELLSDANGDPPLVVAGPHGIDHRYGVRNSVISGGANHDGRARIDTGDDFGDAPDSYQTVMGNTGARHEDLGEEWLGMDPTLALYYFGEIPFMFQPPTPSGSTPEYDAFNGALWPPDPDMVQNILNTDSADDGIVFVGPLIYSQPPPAPPNQGTVLVYVDTANNDVTDGANGRYPVGNATPLGNSRNVNGLGDGVHGPNNNRNLWVNAWFDWNQNGSFDPGEQVFTLACNPTVFGADGAVYKVVFNMPVAPPGAATNGQVWARFRLDYGENAGQPIAAAPVLPHNLVGLSPGGQVEFWDDPCGLPIPGGPVANRYESVPLNSFKPPTLYTSSGLARYGEVEDYVINVGNEAGSNQVPFEVPDQLHLYGPVVNAFPTNIVQTLTAMVENNFVGLPGQTVIFSSVLGNIVFDSGVTNGTGTQSSETTDFNGSALVAFHATATGIAMIQATLPSTGQSAFLFLQVQPPVPGISITGTVLPNRGVTLQLTGTPSQNYAIQRSTDLKNWTTITTAVAPTSGVILFTDTNPPPVAAFYCATPAP